MKKCRGGANFSCRCVTNGGFCTLSEDDTCRLQEDCTFSIGNYVKPNPPLVGESDKRFFAEGAEVKVGSDDKNKIKICCDEITLTKDSVGIEVKIQNLIQNIDKFETIEINGRVFKRVREE